MWQALDNLPWPLLLVLGAVLGWFARTGVWTLQDFGHDAAATARRTGTGLARFVGRLVLVAAVLIVGLFALALARQTSGQ